MIEENLLRNNSLMVQESISSAQVACFCGELEDGKKGIGGDK